MSLPILQIKRRNVNPSNDYATGGGPNGLIAGELGYNYYNDTLWIGPNGDTNGRGYSILLNRDRYIESATWENGTTNGPNLKLTEYDQTGYLRQFRTNSIPAANATRSGIVTVGEQTFKGPKIFAKDDDIKINILTEEGLSIAADGAIATGVDDGNGGFAIALMSAETGAFCAVRSDEDGEKISAVLPDGIVFWDSQFWLNYSGHHDANVGVIPHFISHVDLGKEMKWSTPAELLAACLADSDCPVIDGAHGGTGTSSHTANRLVWSRNSTTIQGGSHYANASKIAVNSTSQPNYNFYVNGTAGFGGDVTVSNGTLKIYRETTKAADAPAKLAFSIKQTDTPVTTDSAYIAVYDDHDAQSYGTNMVITSPSALIIGGGESASSFYTTVVKGSGVENTYITADSTIQFFTNCNTITDRVGVALSNSRAFYPILSSTGTASGTLGTADYNWSAAHVRSIISNDDLTLSSKSGKVVTIDSGSTVYISSGKGSSILFKPQGVEQGRFNASGYLEIISGGAAKATITGPDTAGTFLFPNTGGTFVTHATRGTAVGGSTRPVYIASTGRATAITCLSTVYGGTGNDTQTANRLAYTDSQNKISTANSHYVSGTTVCVNSTTAPSSGANLYVNGVAQIDGELSLDNEVKFVYNSSDKCVDVIFI